MGVTCKTTGQILDEASRGTNAANNANPAATMREWCELITTAANEPFLGLERNTTRGRGAWAMRVNSIWLAVVAGDDDGVKYPRLDARHSGWTVNDDICEPDVMPREINDLLAKLARAAMTSIFRDLRGPALMTLQVWKVQHHPGTFPAEEES